MTTTLAEVAKKAERTEWINVELLDGLGTGRTERAATVKGTLNGSVILSQGTTADIVFVTMADAESVRCLVEDGQL